MASNDPVAQLRRLVECPVCFERSSDQRVLPCLHSFCKDCLNSHMTEQGQSGEFPCPLCKKQFPVPREGATGFQHNFFHAGICDIVLNNDSMNKMHCSAHGDRLLEMYCEQCKVAICSRCATSSHKRHDLKDLDVAAKDAIEVKRDLLKPWREVPQHWEMLRDKRQQVAQVEIQRAPIAVPNVAVNIMRKMEDENISSNFFENFASVAVSSKSPVHRVTPQLAVKHVQLERRFSSLLEGEGEGWCEGLAVGDGVVVVTDSKNKNVKVFDKNTLTFKFTLNTSQHQLKEPRDVTCNRLGEIFITDIGIHGVVKYNARGQLVKAYPGVYEYRGCITCHTDQLIVADRDGGRVLYTDFDCEVHHQIDARSLGLSKFSPRYICVDENTGHVVVSQMTPPRVYVIDPTQPAVIHTFSDGLDRPWGVCVDQFGHILLADSDCCNHCIHLLTPARAHVIATKYDVCCLTAICPSGPGRVYVLEQFGDVKEFSYLDI